MLGDSFPGRKVNHKFHRMSSSCFTGDSASSCFGHNSSVPTTSNPLPSLAIVETSECFAPIVENLASELTTWIRARVLRLDSESYIHMMWYEIRVTEISSVHSSLLPGGSESFIWAAQLLLRCSRLEINRDSAGSHILEKGEEGKAKKERLQHRGKSKWYG